MKEIFVALPIELLDPHGVYERNDPPFLLPEDLDRRKRVLFGQVEPLVEIEEGEVRFWVDIVDGQKTGFFLDQRENRVAVRKYAEGKEVLGGFCYSGGFGLHTLSGGAESLIGIDIETFLGMLQAAVLDVRRRFRPLQQRTQAQDRPIPWASKRPSA